MKKIFIGIAAGSCLLMSLKVKTQTSNDFDKKFRFGLRVTPQPTWFKAGNGDKNNVPIGANFGFGFGLNMEFKLSDIAAILTGIGGDFEGGKYKVKYDPAGNYEVIYWLDENSELVTPKGGTRKNYTAYVLKERQVKSTFVTLPAILKLSTKEYGGFKYFGMFGGELAYRAKTLANETYYELRKYTTDSTFTASAPTGRNDGISINKDASLVPFRIGFNVGGGAEYRLGGSTSLFGSINFFTGLTNFMKKESDYMYYNGPKKDGDKEVYKFVKQNLKLNAVRINLGIMF